MCQSANLERVETQSQILYIYIYIHDICQVAKEPFNDNQKRVGNKNWTKAMIFQEN